MFNQPLFCVGLSVNVQVCCVFTFFFENIVMSGSTGGIHQTKGSRGAIFGSSGSVAAWTPLLRLFPLAASRAMFTFHMQ